jgi:hypothetical protein
LTNAARKETYTHRKSREKNNNNNEKEKKNSAAFNSQKKIETMYV